MPIWEHKAHLVRPALADTDGRAGGLGGDRCWSWGGYAMMWLEGQSTRFKALAAMMGVYDLRADELHLYDRGKTDRIPEFTLIKGLESPAAKAAARVPPAMAIRELSATRPLTLSIACADMTLNPNQPTDRTHAPSARNGMFDGGNAFTRPSLV